MTLFSSLKKKRIDWNRHVSPAHLRVHETHRGKRSLRYLCDIHLANCSSGCNFPPFSTRTGGSRALLLLAGVAAVSRRISYFGTTNRGETNFQQTVHPLFAEAGMQPMPSSLVGRYQSVGCDYWIGATLTILSGNLRCFTPFLRGVSPFWG